MTNDAARYPMWLPRPVRILVGALVLVGALAAISFPVLWLSRLGYRPAPVGIQQRTLPDGTILVLEKVTFDGAHEFKWNPWNLYPFNVTSKSGDDLARASTAPHNSMVLWFARFDPATGKSRDFNWWLASAGVDDDGYEIAADRPGRDRFSRGGHSSESQLRPDYHVSTEKWDLIVAHCVLRPFRHKGASFKYRVYGENGGIVAEFDVPHSAPTSLPNWVPDSVPATKSANGIDVTLTEFRTSHRSSDHGLEEFPNWRVEPQISVRHAQRPANDLFDIQTEFEDEFGTKCTPWDFQLNPRDRAWTLRARLWPKVDDVADNASHWPVGTVSIPGSKATTMLHFKRMISGVAVELIAVGGRESVAYTNPGPTTGQSSRSYGGSFDGIPWGVDVDEGGGASVVTVTSPLPHLLLAVAGLDADHRLVARVTDDRGREVPLEQVIAGQRTVVFMKTGSDATSIDVTFSIVQPHQVEFFVSPPREMQEAAERRREMKREIPEVANTGKVIAWIPGPVSANDYAPLLMLAGLLIGTYLIRRTVQWFNRRDDPRHQVSKTFSGPDNLPPSGPRTLNRIREFGQFLRRWFGPDLTQQ